MTKKWKRADYNTYERILRDESLPEDPISRQLAEHSWRYRQRTGPEHASNHARALRDVALGVVAPTSIAFTLWILEDAAHRGIRRLYFLSRDGQITFHVARLLTEALRRDIDLRYLYASRQSWHRAIDEESINGWISDDVVAGVTTLADIAGRVGISGAELKDLLNGVPPETVAVSPDRGNTGALDALIGNPLFVERQRGLSFEHRTRLDRYFAQEGLYDEVPSGLVDLGWRGTLHETLCRHLGQRLHPPLQGYFFGLTRFQTRYSDCRRGFAFDECRGVPFPSSGPRRDLYVAMETFFAADHGTVVDFRDVNGAVEPQLEATWAPRVVSWGLPIVRDAVMDLASDLSLRSVTRHNIVTTTVPLKALREAFWNRPGRAEAKAWGAFPWDAGQGIETAITPLAESYSIHDCLQALKRPSIRKRLVFWTEGALRMTPAPLRWLLLAGSRMRRWMRPLGRVGATLGFRPKANT